MSKQTINIGVVANDGTGDSLEAGAKINENFDELYSGVTDSTTVTANGTVSDSNSFIICDKSSTLAITLDNGSTVGETKFIVNRGSGTANITLSSGLLYTALSLDQGDASLGWDGVNWYVSGTTGTLS